MAVYKEDGTIEIDGELVPVTVRTNPRARRLIVRVHPTTGHVAVVAPTKKAIRSALKFAESEKSWIADQRAAVPTPVPFRPGHWAPYRGVFHLIRHAPEMRGGVWPDDQGMFPLLVVSGRPAHAPRRIQDWLKKQARRELAALVYKHAAVVEAPITRFTLRDPQTRWGSCSSEGVISLSWRLIMAPPFVMDYVAAHEAAHLIHLNHGRRFWRLVDSLVGDADPARQWLEARGTGLHKYGAI